MHFGPQPKTLRDLSVDNVSKLIREICFRIHIRHDYCKVKRLAAAQRLQQYLVAHIRPLLDEICTYTLSQYCDAAIDFTEDIVLATLMHTQMKALIYANNNLYTMRLSDEFWEVYLEKVPNLVELDVSGIGYNIDNILKVIGSNFPKLEEICITGGRLSEEGFCHLAEAKSLRVIRNVDPDVLYLTMSGNDQLCVTILLQLLPRLEYVHCSCIGHVLLEWNDETPLGLTHCWEKKPSKPRIEAIAKRCPNLQHLRLGHQIRKSSTNSFDASSLVNSSLQISSIELTRFSFTKMLEDFFASNGMFITSIDFRRLYDITIDQVKSLGKHCKNIQDLKIELAHVFRDFPETVQDVPWDDNEYIFENLLWFRFEVNGRWDLTDGLRCLLHSKKIQSVEFETLSWSAFPNKSHLEKLLLDLTATNPMTELEVLTLRGPFTLTSDLIQHLYNLPKLEVLKLEIDTVFKEDEFFTCRGCT